MREDIFIDGGDEIHVDTSEDELMDDSLIEIENVEENINLPEQNLNTNSVENAESHRSEDDWEYVTDDTAFVSINYLGIDPATGLIEVFVHINKKENFILQRTATIGTLKQMIFERKGIPVDIQRLIFTGRILKDETTLQENRIQCGSNIHMFIRIRGGVRQNCNDKNEEANIPKNIML